MVQAGDTLAGIALTVYGDASLWYLIADANGLGSEPNQALPTADVGLALNIPNQVTNVHNNAATRAIYNPSQIIGNTSPQPVPPPAPSSGGSGGIGGLLAEIVVVIIVAVADAYGQEYANELLPDVFGATAVTTAAGTTVAGAGTAFATFAAGAAVGDAAGQLAGDALGIHHGFNPLEVATSAVAAGIDSVGGTSFIGQFAAGAVANAATQGIDILAHQQNGFSWSELAGAAVSAGANSQLVNPGAQGIGAFASNTVGGFTAGVFGQLTQVLLSGHGQIQFASIAADAFGNALGSSIVGAIEAPAPQQGPSQFLGSLTNQVLAGNVPGIGSQDESPFASVPSFTPDGLTPTDVAAGPAALPAPSITPLTEADLPNPLNTDALLASLPPVQLQAQSEAASATVLNAAGGAGGVSSSESAYNDVNFLGTRAPINNFINSDFDDLSPNASGGSVPITDTATVSGPANGQPVLPAPGASPAFSAESALKAQAYANGKVERRIRIG